MPRGDILSIKASINKWVESEFENFEPDNIRKEKIIRDALHDSHIFPPHEINVIDTPIIQRLRRIHQTAFSFLTYPTASHTRFDHTLGVTIIADKLINALIKNIKTNETKKDNIINEVRLAGILHDCGHGPFSHVSENVFGQIPDVKSTLINDPKFCKCKPKPHEMVSYMIVKSSAFCDFFTDISKKYNLDIELNNVANMIVGDMDNPHENSYMSDVINGAFDSDKLDYILRDCYFTGIKMVVDLDRIFYTARIDEREGHSKRMIVDISGAPYLEQLLFNKLLLYPSMYHHHKVRATECMFKSIFEMISDYKLNINGYRFDKITHFLSAVDDDITSLSGKPDELKPLINNINNRDLLKRALIISRHTIKGGDEYRDAQYQTLINLSKDPKKIRDLREIITDKLKGECSVYDIWIDLPDPPSLSEPSRCIIRVTDEDYDTLDNIFPIDRWLTTYAEIKWRGHVFAPPKLCGKVADVAIETFKEEFDIEFNDHAKKLCKLAL